MSDSPSPRRADPMACRALATRLRAAGCVFAEDEARLLESAAGTPAQLEAMAARRLAGEPIEQVIGWAQFGGLRIAVGRGVFVPRRRTEFLASQAAALARPGAVLVDLCCGSGAVGAAIGTAVSLGELHAVDVDRAAVRYARRNIAALGGRAYQGDLYDPLPAALRGRVDIVVANVPYVPTDQIGLMPAEARAHEPLVALDGGADGLDLLRRVAAGAPRWLASGGWLLVEISERQASLATEAFARCRLSPRVVSAADLDATVVMGAMGRASLCGFAAADGG